MPGFHPLAIYYDSPEKTSPSQCRSEIAIPIYGSVKPEAEIKVKRLPKMKVATISHKGSAKEYRNTCKRLEEWMVENEYKWAGPAIEVYSKKPEVIAGETIIYAKILVPVKKK
jgi:effector-binding domain-containing protein